MVTWAAIAAQGGGGGGVFACKKFVLNFYYFSPYMSQPTLKTGHILQSPNCEDIEVKDELQAESMIRKTID